METDERTSSIKPAGVMAMALRMGDQTQHGKPSGDRGSILVLYLCCGAQKNKYILTLTYIYQPYS